MKIKDEKQIEAKKKQILDIAETIITEEGIENLSVRKIAARLNQTPGKDALLASGMEVIPSLYNFLKRLRNEGYNAVSYTHLDVYKRQTIPAPTDWKKLTSSGILTYRKSDNKLYYFYYWKEKAGQTVAS